MSTLKAVDLQHPSAAAANISLASSGNVGLGLSSPAAKLDVVGASGLTSFTGTSFLGLQLRGASSTNDYSGIGFSTTNQGAPTAKIAAYFSGAGSYLQFGTSNSYVSGVTNAAMTIDPSGNLMVGTTGASGRLTSSSTGTIAVYASSTGNHAFFGDTGAVGFYGVYGATSNASYGGTIGYHNGSGVFGILGYAGYGLYTNASIAVNGTVYSSDARLKENVVPLTSALEKLSALNPVSFDWKAASSRGAVSDFGLIAQEVEAVIPEAVFETNTPSRTPEMNGRITLEEELGSYKGVDYSRMIPFLIAGLQELKAQNDELKARVDALNV